MPNPPMLTKSIMSIRTAYFLASSKDEELWNSSIHCSYYSLLQRMLHLLTEVRNPPVDFTSTINSAGSHNEIKDRISFEIKTNAERASFNDGFEWLKKARIQADYKAKLFSQDQCLEIKQKAEALNKKVESYFKDEK